MSTETLNELLKSIDKLNYNIEVIKNFIYCLYIDREEVEQFNFDLDKIMELLEDCSKIIGKKEN